MEKVDCKTKEQWLDNAKKVNLPLLNSTENKVWLVGFALLIWRKAWDLVGNLDERFVKGTGEDTDYGFRLLIAGYRNVLCHNSFIFHYGSVSMNADPIAYNKILKDNKKRLVDKLGFDFNRYSSYNDELVSMVNATLDKDFSVLEVGCGLGMELCKIKYKIPSAHVVGIEENEKVAEIGKKVADVLCLNVEKDMLPFDKKSFDYIFLRDVVNYFMDAKQAICILKEYLKEDGKFIVLTKNMLPGTVFLELLKGKFETIKEGDTQVRHFFTKDEVVNLLSEAGLIPRFLLRMIIDTLALSEEDNMCLEEIKKLPGAKIGEEFNTSSYIITATLN